MIKKFILIKNIKVQKANALSSPYTIGFPAITSWLGAVHALQRHIKNNFVDLSDLEFKAVGIVCHNFSLNIFKESYDNHIILSKNPSATRKDHKFLNTNKSFIPEATCNLDCSLLIEHNIQNQNNKWRKLYESVNRVLNTKLKIAGGDILSFKSMGEDGVFLIDEHNEMELRKLTRKLMPGYFIKERRDLIIDSMKEGHFALSALLDHLKVTSVFQTDKDGKVYLEKSRKGPGWIVPIATGFQGITDIKTVKGQRDFNVPHRFAEVVVTLGEFMMPYRVQNLDEMLWHYCVKQDSNLYICQQKNNNFKEEQSEKK